MKVTNRDKKVYTKVFSEDIEYQQSNDFRDGGHLKGGDIVIEGLITNNGRDSLIISYPTHREKIYKIDEWGYVRFIIF